MQAKPFLKWAGGKTQLIDEIECRLPNTIKETKKIDKYFEPFVGGGAIFFHLVSNYDIGQSFLYDINKELILVYNVIKKNPKELIDILLQIKEDFDPKDQDNRKKFFLDIRSKFNEAIPTFDYENYSDDHITRSAYTIFMNKTCFNGLFRLNKKGEFNVPLDVIKIQISVIRIILWQYPMH